MHCKKCDAVFYIDRGGRTILGEPPDPKAEKERAKAKAKRQQTTTAAPDLKEAWRETPKAVKGLLALAILGLLFYFFIMPIIFRPKTQEPVTIDERLPVVAQAFVDDDRSKVIKYAVPDTVDDLTHWLEQARPKLWVGKDKLMGGEVSVIKRIEAASQDGKQATVVAVMYLPLSIEPPPNLKRTAKGNVIFELPTAWVLNEKQGWQIDGKGTLKLVDKIQIK
jgi:hypothetical protein